MEQCSIQLYNYKITSLYSYNNDIYVLNNYYLYVHNNITIQPYKKIRRATYTPCKVLCDMYNIYIISQECIHIRNKIDDSISFINMSDEMINIREILQVFITDYYIILRSPDLIVCFNKSTHKIVNTIYFDKKLVASYDNTFIVIDDGKLIKCNLY